MRQQIDVKELEALKEIAHDSVRKVQQAYQFHKDLQSIAGKALYASIKLQMEILEKIEKLEGREV